MKMSEQTTKPKVKKPKAPADHQPKKTKNKTTMVRTAEGAQVTMRGITVTMVNEAFDDWELLEALSELDADNPKSITILPGLLKRALAPGDADKVKKLLRDPKTGRIPLRAGVGFFLDLMKAVNPNG